MAEMRNGGRTVKGFVTQLKILRALGKLWCHRHPVSRKLAGAFTAVMREEFSEGERVIVDRLEAFRRRLLASPERVLFYYDGGPSRERTVQEITRRTSQPLWAALVLFKIIRAIQPRVCVEMGTSVGISAAYQASALELNGRGTLVTIEGAPEVARLAERHLRELGLTRAAIVVGQFQGTLERVLKDQAPVDYVFVDGHHDQQATLRYLEQIRPKLSPTALVVLDDIYWSAGMVNVWKTVVADPHFCLTVDVKKMGLAVVDTASAFPKEHVWIRVPAWTVASNATGAVGV